MVDAFAARLLLCQGDEYLVPGTITSSTALVNFGREARPRLRLVGGPAMDALAGCHCAPSCLPLRTTTVPY